MREDRRRRYDDGFRREALELIKSGAGKDTLARRLAIPVYTARNWIMLYRSGGEEAVMGGGGSRRYDWETKVAASRDHVENGLTKAEVMAMHGIASVTPWNAGAASTGPEVRGARAEAQGQAQRLEIQTEDRTDARAGARRTGAATGRCACAWSTSSARAYPPRPCSGSCAVWAEMRHPLQEPVEEVQLVQGRDGRPRA